MSKREEFQKTIEENLALFSARLETLETKAGAAVKAEYKKELEQWRVRGKSAVGKLAELKATVGDKWDAVKVEMTKIMNDLETYVTGAEKAKNTRDDAAMTSSTTAPVSTAVRPQAPPIPLPGAGSLTDNPGAPATMEAANAELAAAVADQP